MIDFIDALKDYLVANTSLVFGTTLFIGNMPETLQSIVVLSEPTSPKYQYELGNKFAYAQKNITIRIRGTEVENVTRALAQTVEDAIENLTDETLGAYYVSRGWFETPPYQLDGTDNNNCYIYVGVYSAIIK